MIYFVQAGANGPVKIGKTKDVARRISMFATAHYEPLVLLATLDVANKYEGKLHRLLRAHRMRGEWFAWCDEVRSVVDLAKKGLLPDFPHTPVKKKVRAARKRRAINEAHSVRAFLDAYNCTRSELAMIATALAAEHELPPVSVDTLYVWTNRGLPAWARIAFAADIDRRKTERAA